MGAERRVLRPRHAGEPCPGARHEELRGLRGAVASRVQPPGGKRLAPVARAAQPPRAPNRADGPRVSRTARRPTPSRRRGRGRSHPLGPRSRSEYRADHRRLRSRGADAARGRAFDSARAQRDPLRHDPRRTSARRRRTSSGVAAARSCGATTAVRSSTTRRSCSSRAWSVAATSSTCAPAAAPSSSSSRQGVDVFLLDWGVAGRAGRGQHDRDLCRRVPPARGRSRPAGDAAATR